MDGARWAQIAAGIGGTALTAYLAKKQGDRAATQDDNRLQMTEEQSLRNTALQESLADPFRHLRDQQRGLTSLDMLQHFGQGRSVTPPANVQPYMGQVHRGFVPSDRLRGDAGKLYDAIASGQGAPTMTDPGNYGHTGAINLSQPGAGVAGQPSATNTAIDPMSYLEGYGRRGGSTGGVMKGAATGAAMGSVVPGAGTLIGAGIGAAVGAARKHAATAPTDLTVDQAKQVIQSVFQQEGGRQASPQELDAILAGQGYKPGDWGVGEEGLMGVIRNLQSNFAKEHRGVAA